MSTPGERLREEIDAKGVSSLARVLGVARNTLYNWSEKGNVPMDRLFELARAGVDLDYVLTGTRRELRDRLNALRVASEAAGPSKSPEALLRQEAIFDALSKVNEEEGKLLAAFRECLPEDRARILELAGRLRGPGAT
ncbi:hypothetical protein [Leptolyngbya phage Lsp-JY19]